MNIDEQVNYLMRGAEYGDQQVFDAMADELRERLIESEKKLVCHSKFIVALTRHHLTCIWVIRCLCANWHSSRSWGGMTLLSSLAPLRL